MRSAICKSYYGNGYFTSCSNFKAAGHTRWNKSKGALWRRRAIEGLKTRAYLALKGIFDRNAAELLRGKFIDAYRCDLPELPDDTFYIADLIGCEVVTGSGEAVGKVISVTPAHTDIYTLQSDKGEISFAAAEGVIESVDVQSKIITVNKKRFKEVSVWKLLF